MNNYQYDMDTIRKYSGEITWIILLVVGIICTIIAQQIDIITEYNIPDYRLNTSKITLFFYLLLIVIFLIWDEYVINKKITTSHRVVIGIYLALWLFTYIFVYLIGLSSMIIYTLISFFVILSYIFTFVVFVYLIIKSVEYTRLEGSNNAGNLKWWHEIFIGKRLYLIQANIALLFSLPSDLLSNYVDLI